MLRIDPDPGLKLTLAGYNNGYAINPARDLMPRIFVALVGWGWPVFQSRGFLPWWLCVPICGPLIGGVLGGALYLACVEALHPTLHPVDGEVEGGDCLPTHRPYVSPRHAVRA